jgi:hypothetical protein
MKMCARWKKLKVPSVLLNDAVVPELRRKFGFRSAYCDVHTAVRPWHRVDYDARCPGAGTFSQVFYAWGELLLRQRELLDGPVWSEGGIHFMFAGLPTEITRATTGMILPNVRGSSISIF